ncbi:MAG: hypothetical protein R6W67_04870 [Bacteroidales bacterium]
MTHLPYSLLLTLLFATAALGAQPFQAGSVYFGQNGYIEYRAGNLPLVITAPHGGTLSPAEIPDRTCGITLTDRRTQELVRELEYEIHRRTGRYPHIIICRLSRLKIDVNRDVNEATCGDLATQPYWVEWHKFIDSAKAAVVKQWGKGFYLDLHGHGHAIQQLEWGYLLSSSQLGLSDATLNLATYIDQSSIRTLASTAESGSTHAALLRGQVSLGTLLADTGIPGVPSAQVPSPGTDPYFSGGYNTRRHGSLDGGTVDGVQLECHSGVRTNHISRLSFASKLSDGLLGFVKAHYFPLLENFYSFETFGTGISFNSFDTPYTQSFDNVFPGVQTHYYSDNDPGFPGSYTLMTLGGTQPQEYRNYTVGASVAEAGYLYNAGHIGTSSDRAVGLMYSSTTGPVAFGLRFVNNIGAGIRSIEIQYTGEQWRVGGSTGPPSSIVANTLEFDYLVSDRAVNVRSGGYVSVPALDFVSPNTDPFYLRRPVDGNSSENRTVLSATINVSIPVGGEIMLRWSDRTDDPGFDHLLAIDDLVVTPRSYETSVSGGVVYPGRLRIYPNPTSGSMTLDIPGEGQYLLEIRAVTSSFEMIQVVESGEVTVDIGHLSCGIYLVRLMRRNGVYGLGRLIVMK